MHGEAIVDHSFAEWYLSLVVHIKLLIATSWCVIYLDLRELILTTTFILNYKLFLFFLDYIVLLRI